MMNLVLMEVDAELKALGFGTSWDQYVDGRVGLGVDAVLVLSSGEAQQRFGVVTKGRAAYPNEIDALEVARAAASGFGAPLYLAPAIPESTGKLLNDRGWSWADAAGNVGIQAGTWRVAQRKSDRPRPVSRSFPGGSGAYAIVRALLTFEDGEVERNGGGGRAGPQGLANQAGVTQPRASQVLKQLVDLGLVSKEERGWVPDRPALLDAFIANYRGPKGSEVPVLTLDSPRAFTAEIAALADQHGGRCVVSADVGPDALVGWRRPSVAILYLDRPLDVTQVDAVRAKGRHDANVLLRFPEDTSVFPGMHRTYAEIDGTDVELAPISQQLWDLHDLGGSDRIEVAGRLRSWYLDR